MGLAARQRFEAQPVFRAQPVSRALYWTASCLRFGLRRDAARPRLTALLQKRNQIDHQLQGRHEQRDEMVQQQFGSPFRHSE